MLWLILGGIFALGCILAVIGFGTGAVRHLRIGSQGIKLVRDERTDFRKTEANAGPFTNVKIDLPATWTAISFKSSDHYGYEYQIFGNSSYYPSDTVEDSTLRITLKSNPRFWGDFNLDWNDFSFGSTAGKQGKIIVYVPRDVSLNTVELNFAAGKYTVGPLTARQVRVQCPAGQVQLGAIDADQVDLRLTSGRMRADGITADALTGSLTAGELSLSAVSANNVSLKATSGNLQFRGDAAKQLDTKVTAGSVILDLARPRRAYALSGKQSAGSVQVDGRSLTGSVEESNPGLTQLTLRVTAGSLDVNFARE